MKTTSTSKSLAALAQPEPLTFGADAPETAAEFFERRRASAHATPQPHLRDDRLYFCELDRCTHVRVLGEATADAEAARLLAAIRAIAPRLEQRIVERARTFRPDHGAHLPHDLRGAPRADVELISQAQLGCARRAWGDLGVPATRERIARAYERFASGQLRHPLGELSVCEPDSAYYFMFAEFALLAREIDVDRADWDGLLCGLVRSQLLYAYMYGPTETAPRPFAAFHRAHLGDRSVSERSVALLRSHFANLGVRELEFEMSRHCAMFFRSDAPLDLAPPRVYS